MTCFVAFLALTLLVYTYAAPANNYAPIYASGGSNANIVSSGTFEGPAFVASYGQPASLPCGITKTNYTNSVSGDNYAPIHATNGSNANVIFNGTFHEPAFIASYGQPPPCGVTKSNHTKSTSGGYYAPINGTNASDAIIFPNGSSEETNENNQEHSLLHKDHHQHERAD